MRKLKRDTRACPYCAETIKAAATRCRFCQSDVTPVTEPRSEPQPEQKPAGASKLPPETVSEGTGVTWKQIVPGFQDIRSVVVERLTLVLAALVLLAGAGVGVAWWRAEQGTSTVAPDGSLIAEDARTKVLIEAADLTQRALSYDHKTLTNDMEVARDRMTPSFRKEYDATMKQVRANTEKHKIVVEAAAVASAIIRATEHKATVLVMVKQVTTGGIGKKRNQQLTRNSLVVTLARGGGDWNMSNVNAVG